jgi:hypothetical protein
MPARLPDGTAARQSVSAILGVRTESGTAAISGPAGPGPGEEPPAGHRGDAGGQEEQ